MSRQIQCPNCGGFKVVFQRVLADPKTNKVLDENITTDTSWTTVLGWSIGLLICWGGVYSFLIYPFMEEYLSWTLERICGSWATWGIVLAPSIIAFIVLIKRIRREHSEKEVELAKAIPWYRCECSICGYKWDVPENVPQLRVPTQLDLIAKAMQQEQERLQKQRGRGKS